MGEDRIRLGVSDARSLGERALAGIGYPPEEAAIVTDHVIDAALCGYEYSGLAKLLNIPEHRRFARPRRPVSVIRETPVSALLDGGNNVGMLAVYHAARAAIDKAQRQGFALIGLTNSWMSGRSAYYCEMIARADLVSIHTAASPRGVAPPGGKAAALGTNPIAFGMPTDRGPVALDMGTSAFMLTEVALIERLGRLLPEGVAIDPEGRPTRDPGLARQGAILPFGGYKGFGLGLFVQAFGVLAGSALGAEQDDGYLFIVFKPDLLLPLAEFKREASGLVERVKATPRQPGVEEIRIPSERAFRSRERFSREGLEIDRPVYDALLRLAG